MKKLVVLLSLIMTIHAGGAYSSDDAKHKYMINDTEITNPDLLTKELEGDIVYGDADASVTIVEYASLSCSHCGNFYTQTFKEFKSKYVDSGKVKFIYRHFPLNLPALQAMLLVECLPDAQAKQHLLGSLFSTQGQWAYGEDFTSKLKAISRIAGIDEKEFNDCISDTQKEERLLALMLQAQQGLSVRSTPTLFINGKVYTGAKTVDALSKLVDDLI